MRFLFIAVTASIALATLGCESAPPAEESRPPNIILVMTDDQGYGDVGAHGNPMIKTPNLDKLHGESVRLTNYHVDPTCAPTRSALLSGRYSSRTGVWHTIMGRSIVHEDETLISNILSEAGYTTGFFGKWHLGDNYPHRPEDRAFDEVVRHGGGGVQQTPDYWGNDYFDDTYWHNSVPTKYEGYCTDVFFREGMRFIEENKDKPFFAYIPTNAPHGPLFVEERYVTPYLEQGVPEAMAKFYGMIENIDDNMGLLTAELDELGLSDNTILIFTTDNGTANGVNRDGSPYEDAKWGGFNDGMRGKKGSQYEGGHRVPFFVRWPAGNLGQPRDIANLSAHIDVLPTLAELAGVSVPAGIDIDGKSLVPLLKGSGDLPSRTLFVHSQRIEWPEKWKTSSVMTDRWRLIDGKELYDLDADPGQQNNVAADNKEVFDDLRGQYDQWWDHISTRFEDHVLIMVGGEENPARITAHDWHPPEEQAVPWNQPAIQRNPHSTGYWMINVAEAGEYEFALLQHDKDANYTIDAVEARIKVGDVETKAAVPANSTEVALKLDLPAGEAKMETWFTDKAGKERGAFFVYAKKL